MSTKRFSPKSNLLLYHAGAAVAVIGWGVSFISTKVLLDNGLHPIEIYIYRFTLAYLAMLLICHKRIFCSSLRHELTFMLAGLFGGSIYFISENVALEYTLVSNVSLITSLSPLLTVLLIGFVYRSDRPGRETILGSIVAFLGVGLVIFNSSFSLSIKPLGDLLSLLAALCWAIYSIVLKQLNPLYSALFITRKTFFYGVVTAVPFLIIEPEITPPTVLLNPLLIGNLLFLALFCSMFAYLMWAVIIGKIGAVKASNYMYFQPVVTLIFSYIILGEKISIVGYTGCAMILLGVWMADFLQNRKMKIQKRLSQRKD
ncbi:MAG: DMT family transporter [Bacteroides sp.]|nr:DMT family transporter [Bacteroides sp.]